jgi:hypothetical protein
VVSEHVPEYRVDSDLLDPLESEFACHAVLGFVLARVETAWIDAYSDEDDLPEAAREAQKELFRMGRARESGDPGMGIDLDVSRSDHVRLLRTFDHSGACPRGQRRQGAWFRAGRQCHAGRFRLAGATEGGL